MSTPKSDMPRSVIAIMGPTAAGKTALACALAERIPVRIISADSALIYRGMDIGSGKPTAGELQRYPHHLIDICDPSERYSVGRFCTDVNAQIDIAFASGQTPLLVGGTMMYFKALLRGLAQLPEADPDLRAKLQNDCDERGLAALHERLVQVDPVAGARIHVNDPQRILRALEVFMLSGRPMSSFFAETNKALAHPCLQIAVMPQQRQSLSARIEARFDQMLANGLVEEVKRLRERGDLHLDLPSMRCVGYRQVWEYLDDSLPYEQMRIQAIAATRALAKRQYTWLRDWPLDLRLDDSSEQSVTAVLKRLAEGPI